MRVAYICFLPNPMSGVVERYKDMAKLSQKSELNLTYILLNNTIDKQEENFFLKKMHPLKIPIYLKTQQKLFTHALIEKNIDFTAFDIVILRYPGSCSITSWWFYKKHLKKLITEHHTNEDKEYQLYKNGFLNTLKFSLEPWCAKKLFPNLLGLIGVTKEITQLELKKSGSNDALTLSNGIDTEKYHPYIKPPLHKTFELILVASNDMPWHGVDRVIDGILAYTGIYEIKLHLVGEFSKEKYQYPFIIHHGTLHGKSLDEAFAQAHLAIATLGLHRKDMSHAVPLKTREYLARGIPFVYAYEDDDFDSTHPFCKQIIADDSALDIYAMIQFIKECSSTPEQIRRFASKTVDWSIKFTQLQDYLQKLYNARQ